MNRSSRMSTFANAQAVLATSCALKVSSTSGCRMRPWGRRGEAGAGLGSGKGIVERFLPQGSVKVFQPCEGQGLFPAPEHPGQHRPPPSTSGRLADPQVRGHPGKERGTERGGGGKRGLWDSNVGRCCTFMAAVRRGSETPRGARAHAVVAIAWLYMWRTVCGAGVVPSASQPSPRRTPPCTS